MIKIEYEGYAPVGVLVDDEKIRHSDISINSDDKIVLDVESHDDELTFKKTKIEELPTNLIFNLLHYGLTEYDLFPDSSWTLNVEKGMDLYATFILEIELSQIPEDSYNRSLMAFSKKLSVMPKSSHKLTVEHSSEKMYVGIYCFLFKFELSSFGSVLEAIRDVQEALEKKLLPIYEDVQSVKNIKIFCEGKTDYLHLKAALRYFQRNERFSLLTLEFCDEASISGDADLDKFCANLCKVDTNEIIIAIFDNDSPIGRKQIQEGKNYKEWGNNVFSMKLPVSCESSEQDICIELYYDKKEFRKSNQQGRRLFLRSEFDATNGLSSDRKCYTVNPKNTSLIVDPVYDFDSGKNIALSKNDFAKKILDEVEPYQDISFEEFHKIFDVINEIKKEHGSFLRVV